MEIWTEQVKNAVYHEVGHWIASKDIGFLSKGIMLGLGVYNGMYLLNKGYAHTLYRPSLATLDDVVKYLLDRATVGVSGINCQNILLGTDISDAKNNYGGEDFEKVQELSLIYRGIRYPEDQSEGTEREQRDEFILNAFKLSKKIIDANHLKIKFISENIISMIVKEKEIYEIDASQLDEWYFDMK